MTLTAAQIALAETCRKCGLPAPSFAPKPRTEEKPRPGASGRYRRQFATEQETSVDPAFETPYEVNRQFI